MSTVEVILQEHIDKLGNAGDIVKVKMGHARNFLLPGKLAKLATLDNLLELKEQLSDLKANADAKRAAAVELKNKLEALGTLETSAKVGATGKLFGRITQNEVLSLITDKMEVPFKSKAITLKDVKQGINELGDFDINIDLGSSVFARLKLSVTEEV